MQAVLLALVMASSDPIPPKGLYVQVRETNCLERSSTGGLRAVTRLVWGQQLTVPDDGEGPDRDGYQRASLGNGITCLVSPDALTPVRPDPAQELAKAREALANARLVDAVLAAERASAGLPQEREPLEILAAIHDAAGHERGAKDVYARLQGLKKAAAEAPATTPSAPAPEPQPQDKRYVTATRLRLRQEPRADAPVLQEVFINTPVTVGAVDGAFARVTLARRARESRVIRFGTHGEEVAQQEAQTITGYLAWAYLAEEPVNWSMLLTQALEHEQAGRMADATVLLERAALLHQEDPSLFQRLARAAVAARRWQVAAWAAHAVANWSPGGSVKLQVLYGCRGKRERAEILAADQLDTRRLNRVAKDACVTGMDVLGPCHANLTGDCGESEPGPGDSKETLREKARTRAEIERHNVRAQAEYRKAVAAHTADLTRMLDAFPDGPWVHAVIQGRSGQVDSSKRLYAFAVAVTVNPDCDHFTYEVGQVYGVSHAGVAWPGDGDASVWIQIPSYTDVLVGFVEDRTPEGATAQLDRLLGDLKDPCAQEPPAATPDQEWARQRCQRRPWSVEMMLEDRFRHAVLTPVGRCGAECCGC